MDKDLSSYMDMYAGVEDYLKGNSVLLDKYARLKEEFSIFSTNRADLEIQVRKQTSVVTGITADKKGSFGTLGDTTISLGLRAVIWARDNNNQALVTIFTITQSDFRNQTFAQKLDKAKAMYAAVNGNIAALTEYNINETEVAAFADLIKKSDVANIAPTKHRQIKKTAKTAVESIQLTMAGNLKNMDDMINGSYLAKEPNFVTGYVNSRKVDSKGVRHTGISATITDAATSKAIENATLIIADLNKTATSNMAGLAEIIKMKAGSYHISISAEGYTTQLMDITVGKSKVIDLVVALVLA